AELTLQGTTERSEPQRGRNRSMVTVRLGQCWRRWVQRARAALRAMAERCCLVSLRARAGPPFLPPSRPSATAAGFLPPCSGAASEAPVVCGCGGAGSVWTALPSLFLLGRLLILQVCRRRRAKAMPEGAGWSGQQSTCRQHGDFFGRRRVLLQPAELPCRGEFYCKAHTPAYLHCNAT